LSRLALGTAQFGLDYGISNKLGKIPRNRAFEILDFAAAHGIDMLDTAAAYGDSETVLGEYTLEHRSGFEVVSKLPAGGGNGGALEGSLAKLKRGSLYGYLIHDFGSFLAKPEIWADLLRKKDRGLVRKIGFSLYHPRDIGVLDDKRIVPDLLQFPYSLFDQRFEALLGPIKARGIEIHIRSVFLQGLVFKKPEELKGRFAILRPKSIALHALARRTGVPVSALALGFVLSDPRIDKVIIGVESLDNLKENLDGLGHAAAVRSVYQELKALREDDENIILPFLWESA
jgi:aryl-alcohol dehydrogenase-like predicted oxidoreductase